MSGSEPTQSVQSLPALKGDGGGGRRIGDVWQWLGMSGDAVGTSGIARATFLYGFAIMTVLSGTVDLIAIITRIHDTPGISPAAPIVWEGSSWVSWMLLFWIPWVAYRLASPLSHARWRLLLHIPMAVIFAAAHVTVFVLLRKLAYAVDGATYDFGPVAPRFLYELAKDGLGYSLTIAGFSVTEHLLRLQSLVDTPGQTLTFDIRDGAKLTRVRLDDVLAITSAGNYVEFLLNDGRRLMMRSPLSTLETELSPRGFLRTHRSWLVNASRLTALTPEGSGDYEVELGPVKAPLSRRFPDALARLKGK